MKISICGSMTVAKEMLEVGEKLVNLGHKVILPAFTEDYSKLKTDEERHNESYQNKINHDLIRGYFDEIKESDAVLVVNLEKKGVKGYIGGNSFLEMGFGHVLNKKIYLLNDIPEMIYKDELIAMQPIIINNDLSLIK